MRRGRTAGSGGGSLLGGLLGLRGAVLGNQLVALAGRELNAVGQPVGVQHFLQMRQRHCLPLRRTHLQPGVTR